MTMDRQAPRDMNDTVSASALIARIVWDSQDLGLHLIGIEKGSVHSDSEYRLFDTWLDLVTNTDGRLLSEVPLGELTLPAEHSVDQTPLEVPAVPLGSLAHEGNISVPLAAETDDLPRGDKLLLIHLIREVQWGLSEYYSIPVTIRNRTLHAGDRIQSGRDAMVPPSYFGSFFMNPGAGGPELVLQRKGTGAFEAIGVYREDESGSFRAVRDDGMEPTIASDGPPMVC